MTRTCTVCTHPDREAIDLALTKCDSLRDIARRHGLSKDSLARHKKDHIPLEVTKAEEAREVIRAGSLLEKLQEINRDTRAIFQEVRKGKSKNNSLALKALARLEKQIELEGRILGELQTGPSINILISPEWQQLRTIILKALEPHPLARLAVVEALQSHLSSPAGDPGTTGDQGILVANGGGEDS